MKRFTCFLFAAALLCANLTALAEDDPFAIDTPIVNTTASVSALVEETVDTGPETILMSVGARNQGVTLLQQALIDRGFLAGEADGVFGSGTREAVKSFQEAESCEYADGYVRLSTLLKLDTQHAGKTLDIGSSGLLVYGVQKLMAIYGYYGSSPDCDFGSGTKAALKTYMETVAGEMAEFVMAKAEEEKARVEAQAETDEDAASIIIDVPILTAETVRTSGAVDADWMDYLIQSTVPIGETVRRDDRGNEVRRMQRRLSALNYIATSADGVFGQTSELALKYFQRRNGLTETGVCDEATQKRLYNDNAEASDVYVSPYSAKVSTKQCKVWIYKWTGSDYGDLVKTFVCSTGSAANPTIKGTFQAPGQNGVWYKMDGCWVMYTFVIDGGYFFHSVLFNNQGDKKPTSTSVANLGKNVSHGCVRLAVEDAQWIYENCMPGMTVVIE